MKIFRKRIILVAILVLLIAGCGNSTQSDINKMFDYKNIDVPSEEYQISVDDLNLALEMYANMIDDPNESFDSMNEEQFIEMYSVKSLDELKKLSIYNMVEHRFIEYIINYIYDNVSIGRDGLKKTDEYISRLELINRGNAEKADQNYDLFIENNYGMNVREYVSMEQKMFTELYIMKCILEAEGIEISKEDIQTEYVNISEDYGISVEEIKDIIPQERIEHDLAYKIVYANLKDKYEKQILEAYDEQVSILM